MNVNPPRSPQTELMGQAPVFEPLQGYARRTDAEMIEAAEVFEARM